MNPPVPSDFSIRARLRRVIIWLGWIGVILFVANIVTDNWTFETVSHDLLRAFDLVMFGLFALWPISVWLQFKSRLGDTLRAIVAGLLVLLIIPWGLLCALFMVTEDDAPWEDQLVQYESALPPVCIVQQSWNGFATIDTKYRVVKITPLFGFWQRVEPADPVRYPEVHYRPLGVPD
ncbi:hypothetical protein LJY25_11040 [Hymenobacter sp. BT175]|uniref:hypothetical protein n=1 Tax=Hymenobacter translucens TaxID=2886507 RepID=UPI001D0E5107|nr:hypothetical protein [Hymenobacter translucens]MCC2546982.1 hypothetical protein [Hymenobacter translucens]